MATTKKTPDPAKTKTTVLAKAKTAEDTPNLTTLPQVYDPNKMKGLKDSLLGNLNSLEVSIKPLQDIQQNIKGLENDAAKLIQVLGDDKSKYLEYKDQINNLKSSLVKARTGPESGRQALVKPANDYVSFVNDIYKSIESSVKKIEEQIKPIVQELKEQEDAEKARKAEEKAKQLNDRIKTLGTYGAKIIDGFYVIQSIINKDQEVSFQVTDLQSMTEKSWQMAIDKAKEIHDSNEIEEKERLEAIEKQRATKAKEEAEENTKKQKELEDLRSERMEARLYKLEVLGFVMDEKQNFINSKIGTKETYNSIADMNREDWNMWIEKQNTHITNFDKQQKENAAKQALTQHGFSKSPDGNYQRSFKNINETISISLEEWNSDVTREDKLKQMQDCLERENKLKIQRESNHNVLINAGLKYDGSVYKYENKSPTTPELKYEPSILDESITSVLPTIEKHKVTDNNNFADDEKKAKDDAENKRIKQTTERQRMSNMMTEIQTVLNKYIDNFETKTEINNAFNNFRKQCEKLTP
jgi:hypothetical protein